MSELPNIAPPAVGYFVDSKKGEVNELKQLLKNLNTEKDIRRKREVIKKVIAYMTLGIDVSRLFTDMIMAIETKDIVLKKMIYLYLSNYAHSEPDMAIMCINSLRRDCDNEDPLVRGLALRSLCSLRLESILEYVEQPLLKAFSDISSYVRKTAVMQVIKIHHLSPSFVENNNYIPQLNRMLSDPDPNVVTNAIYVINELQLSQGGLQATPALIMALLNRIGEFSEWGLTIVLDILSRYVPQNEEEIFGIMNLLDPILRTANSGSVLATLKCFYTLTASLDADMQKQVTIRSKPSLITLITGSYFEAQYITLKHIEIILKNKNNRGIFADEYRQFFIRYNEPNYVKHLKVTLLPAIASSENAKEIAQELEEYITDIDEELSKKSIEALSQIIMNLPDLSHQLTTSLLQFLDIETAYIRNQACIVLSNIVRIYPNLGDLFLPNLDKYFKKITNVDSRCSLLWLLGEFGTRIREAPYILEQILKNLEEETNTKILLFFLNASIKLFIYRAPEMVNVVKKIFTYIFLLRDSNGATTSSQSGDALAAASPSPQDLYDKALLYYRLLQQPDFLNNLAKQMYEPGLSSIKNSTQFSDNNDDELDKKIFAEFNTLAVVFNLPSVEFIEGDKRLLLENLPVLDFSFPSATDIPGMKKEDRGVADNKPVVDAPVGSLLDLDEPVTSPSSSSTLSSFSGLAFKDVPFETVTPAMFQQNWANLPDAFNSSRLFTLGQAPGTIQDLESLLKTQKIFSIASGFLTSPQGQNLGFKYFLYGIDAETNTLFLMQLLYTFSTSEVSLVLKVDKPSVFTPAKISSEVLPFLAGVFQPFKPSA